MGPYFHPDKIWGKQKGHWMCPTWGSECSAIYETNFKIDSSIIARRHGHVFRMALHNEGDWRMETWQRARQGESSCLHTPIPELCNAILNTCQMPSRFYIIPSNVIKTVYSPRSYGGPYMQAKHAGVCSGVLFELRARAARTCCHCHLAVKNPIHDGKRGQLKLPKSHERYHNVVMWHWIVYKWRRSKQMLSFHRTFFNLLDFTVSLSCRDCHSETPWSHSSNQPGGTYCQARDFLLRTNYTLEMWCANAKLANQVPINPVKTIVIPTSWSDRCFELQER